MKLVVLVCGAVFSLAHAQATKADQKTGRFNNVIDTPTLGCKTVPLLESAIKGMLEKRPLPAGCFDLNHDEKNLPVIGPLKVVNPTPAKPCKGLYGSTCWALVEVRGKGELWTFLVHLKDGHGN